MAVTINTNTAATIGANNLAVSSDMLQKSLNRLSSGSKIQSPADDAGGLAVSMKLSAAANRQGAVSSNIANAVSLLQTQDSILSSTGKILSRMSELKVMDADVTKSSTDRANYQVEFAALQIQLSANAGEKFNGINLFGSSGLNVKATEDGTSSIALQGINLSGGATPVAWSNIAGVTPGADWTSSDPVNISNGAGYTRFHTDGTLTTTQANISGPYSINFSFMDLTDGTGTTTLSGGGGGSLDLHSLISTFDNSDHTISMNVDASGSASWSYDGGAQTGTIANFGSASGSTLTFALTGNLNNDLHVKDDFTLTSTGGGGGSGNIASVTGAPSLSGLSLNTITDAISDVATYRAQNGASQSRLGFASDLLTVNKANLEAANSRIVDVDVAKESTSLARFNVLVQAGTAMLSQANQSSQIALKLLQ